MKAKLQANLCTLMTLPLLFFVPWKPLLAAFLIVTIPIAVFLYRDAQFYKSVYGDWPWKTSDDSNDEEGK